MIPRVDFTFEELGIHAVFLARLKELGFAGEVSVSRADRAVYATDNSIYQRPPCGLAFPQHAGDLQLIARLLGQPAFADVTIAMRGGGTGTNGQSLTGGITVDCSRHMNRILEIDPVRRIARVEAGVVKDELNLALRPHGLFFAPELSTSNRATIGGMVSTDASGQGSCLYGKTSSHVAGLRAFLIDGTECRTGACTAEELTAHIARGGRIGAILDTLDRVETESRPHIPRVFLRLNRYLTGYDLAHLRSSGGGIDLNAVLCGSEGTLALIAEAELRLSPVPPCSALVMLGYGDFIAALEDAQTLIGLNVAAIETMDGKVLSLGQSDMSWSVVAHLFPMRPGQAWRGVNLIEVIARNEDELQDKLREVERHLAAVPAPGRLAHSVTRGAAETEAVWNLRKRAVGLLGSAAGAARPVAFVEDTAVPPEMLPSYIREFRSLLDATGLDYGMFGHVDAGVLHVRPALDLTREDHAAKVREISDGVVALTRKYGGVFWGEHGKGLRSEYVPAVFGPLYPALQQIKAAFDPNDQLNPGKIAAPPGGKLLRLDDVALRGSFDRLIPVSVRQAYDNATTCNGNGACFDFDVSNAMCPSFKGTRDRRLSPKGRAGLIREWLQRLATAGVDVETEATARPGVLHVFRRTWNTLDPRNRRDFSHEVRASLDTCLGCKACAGQCPVKVNVPAFRSRFLELYYGRYLRPPGAALIGWIEAILPLMAHASGLYNAILPTALARHGMRLLGLVALPKLPAINLARELRRRGIEIASQKKLSALPQARRKRVVVFIADPFTRHFDPVTLLAACELAARLGDVPMLARPLRNGKPLHVHGYLRAFRRHAAATSQSLQRLYDQGVQLVGLDPSMTLTFRSEYPAAGIANASFRVLLPQEWLAGARDALQALRRAWPTRDYALLMHCTEQTNLPAASAQWAEVFRYLGIQLQVPRLGCCGMAGTFGHEARNRPLAEHIYGLSWAEAIGRAGKGEILMATGYSCRTQASLISGLKLPHPVSIINGLLSGQDDEPTAAIAGQAQVF